MPLMLSQRQLLAASLTITRKRLMESSCRLSYLSLCRSVRKVYCRKTADWIQMPFRMMSGVGRGMGALDGGSDRRREGAVLGVNVGISL